MAHYHDLKWMLGEAVMPFNNDQIQREVLKSDDPLRVSYCNGKLIKLEKV